MLGAGLGLTLALQATTLRSGDFKVFYSVVVTLSRLAALVGTYLSIVGIFLVAHIQDPLNGLIAIGAKSATVVGAEGWLCDAMATAVMVAGQEGAKWFGQPELAGYQVFAVTRHEQTAWSI
jgi:hypothetical protein